MAILSGIRVSLFGLSADGFSVAFDALGVMGRGVLVLLWHLASLVAARSNGARPRGQPDTAATPAADAKRRRRSPGRSGNRECCCCCVVHRAVRHNLPHTIHRFVELVAFFYACRSLRMQFTGNTPLCTPRLVENHARLRGLSAFRSGVY